RGHGAMRMPMAALVLAAGFLVPGRAAAVESVSIGSKAFPESWILGEALASLARSAGALAEHRANLGGTEIVFEALRRGSVDLYPEYTGTISQVLLKSEGQPTIEEMRDSLERNGIGISPPLGFN